MTKRPSILRIEERSGMMLLRIVECDTLGKVRVRSGYRSELEQCRPYGTMPRHQHGRVLDLRRQGQELLVQCVCYLVLGTHLIILPQTTQDREKLVWIFKVFTELPSTRVGLSDFRS